MPWHIATHFTAEFCRGTVWEMVFEQQQTKKRLWCFFRGFANRFFLKKRLDNCYSLWLSFKDFITKPHWATLLRINSSMPGMRRARCPIGSLHLLASMNIQYQCFRVPNLHPHCGYFLHQETKVKIPLWEDDCCRTAAINHLQSTLCHWILPLFPGAQGSIHGFLFLFYPPIPPLWKR